MADYDIQAAVIGIFQNHTYYSTYAACRTATEADRYENNASTVVVGQKYVNHTYTIWRGVLVFDLSALPEGASITDVELRLYGETDVSDTNFDTTVVEGSYPADALSPESYDQLESTSFGTLASGSMAVDSWNSITLNATGLANVISQGKTVKLGLISSNDINNVAPTESEYVSFNGVLEYGDYTPVLRVTIDTWGKDVFPTVPTFPDTGHLDEPTYYTITGLLTDITAAISGIMDTDGDIVFADTDKHITWTGTGETIQYDLTNDRIEATSIADGSTVAIGDDLVLSGNLTTTTLSCNDLTITGCLTLNDTAYASIKAKIPEDILWFDGMSDAAIDTMIAGLSNGEGAIFQISDTGDLIWVAKLGDVVRRHMLADYSTL